MADADESPGEGAHVRERILQHQAVEMGAEGPDGRDTDVRALADGEREAVTFEGRVAGVQDDVRRGVVGVRVHGVRAIVGASGREADVERLDARDGQ